MSGPLAWLPTISAELRASPSAAWNKRVSGAVDPRMRRLRLNWLGCVPMVVVGSLASAAESCATVQTIALADSSRERVDNRALQIRVSSSDIVQPVTVDGGRVAFSEVDRALHDALLTATRSIEFRSAQAQRQLELSVEILEASARLNAGQIQLSVHTRATLRDTDGNVALAQTHAHIRDAFPADSAQAAPRFRAALATIANTLAGWLRGLELDTGTNIER